MKNTKKILMTVLGLATAAFTYAVSGYPFTPYPGCPIPCTPCECCCEPLMDFTNYGVQLGVQGCQTQRLVFSGLLQTDYQFIHVEDKAPNQGVAGGSNAIYSPRPTDTNNFLIRRARLGFEADLGECWKGVVFIEFAGRSPSTIGSASVPTKKASTKNLQAPPNENSFTTENIDGIFQLYEAYIEKYFCNLFLRAGYKKVNFVYEENIEDYDLKTIERSIATNFFDGNMIVGPASGGGLGIGAQHVGVFADAFYKGFSIGGALVNGYQGTDFKSNKSNNELGYFAYASYEANCNCFDLLIGINAAYLPKGNNLTLSSQEGNDFNLMYPRGSIIGWNPYAKFVWKCFYLMGEIIGARVEKGAVDALKDANPIGGNLLASYSWKCWEFVGRLSYLNTDKRGTLISGIVPSASNTFDNIGSGDIYDKAFSLYGGVNYYMLNRALKLSAGYEYTQLKNRHSGLLVNPTTVNDNLSTSGFTQSAPSSSVPSITLGNAKSYVHTFRARLQLVF